MVVVSECCGGAEIDEGGIVVGEGFETGRRNGREGVWCMCQVIVFRNSLLEFRVFATNMNILSNSHIIPHNHRTLTFDVPWSSRDRFQECSRIRFLLRNRFRLINQISHLLHPHHNSPRPPIHIYIFSSPRPHPPIRPQNVISNLHLIQLIHQLKQQFLILLSRTFKLKSNDMTWFPLQLSYRSNKFRSRSKCDIIAIAVLVPELEVLCDNVPFADLERRGWESEDEVDPQGTALCFTRGGERDANVAWRRSHRLSRV